MTNTAKYIAMGGSVRKVADRELQGTRYSIGGQRCICAGFNMRWLPVNMLWQYDQGHSAVGEKSEGGEGAT
jgi:hypothetical protein